MKKKIKNSIKSILNQLPYISTLNKINSNSCFPAGHYYSTVVSIDEIKSRHLEIWKELDEDGIPGINLNEEGQIKLFRSLSKYYNELPFKSEKQTNLKYYFKNNYYSYNDGIILYSMIRSFKPKRIIEIGSGFSSANMLDTNELFFNNQISLLFIEPFPEERLNQLINKTDQNQTKIIQSKVQEVPLNVFKELQAGDILFVDSSHAVKTGSDVNYILFDILPSLQEGVLVHFHDIHYPFEYPKDWVFKGIGWNETYFLKAFLMYNNKFKIRLFTEYLDRHHHEKTFMNMPFYHKGSGSSLWIEKI